MGNVVTHNSRTDRRRGFKLRGNYWRGGRRQHINAKFNGKRRQIAKILHSDNYLYDKSWTNRSYEVGGLRCVINMCTQPWHVRVAFIVLYVSYTNRRRSSCVSLPVYRRLAVAKCSKSTMYKLLTWPWPRPLREQALITRLRLRMADPCTKFEVSRDFTWGVKF